MSIELIIDTRERELISLLSEKITIKIEQLEIGDILFRKENDNIFVIERKTVNDLKASICDGRAREQKNRLMGSTTRERILYLIEGSLNKSLNDKIQGLPVGTLIGSLVNTQLRDGIKVYKTESIQETVFFLIKLLEKFNKDGENYFGEDKLITSSEYCSGLKKSKKANMTPTVWFITQLCLIPQISDKIAEEIVNIYPNVKALIAKYESTPEMLRNKLLCDIKYPIKNNKMRRIGEKMSERVYHYFYGVFGTE